MRPLLRRMNRSGGVVLDLVLSTGLVLMGAFALNALGISFGELVRGASQFFSH